MVERMADALDTARGQAAYPGIVFLKTPAYDRNFPIPVSKLQILLGEFGYPQVRNLTQATSSNVAFGNEPC